MPKKACGSSAGQWLVVWLLAAAVALSIGVTTMWRQAARLGAPLAAPSDAASR